MLLGIPFVGKHKKLQEIRVIRNLSPKRSNEIHQLGVHFLHIRGELTRGGLFTS